MEFVRVCLLFLPWFVIKITLRKLLEYTIAMKQKQKKNNLAPHINVLQFTALGIIASSLTGFGSDSDDFEFGYSQQRRGWDSNKFNDCGIWNHYWE